MKKMGAFTMLSNGMPLCASKEAEYLRHMKEAKGGKLLDFAHGEVVEPKYCYPPWLEQQWSQKWGVRQEG